MTTIFDESSSSSSSTTTSSSDDSGVCDFRQEISDSRYLSIGKKSSKKRHHPKRLAKAPVASSNMHTLENSVAAGMHDMQISSGRRLFLRRRAPRDFYGNNGGNGNAEQRQRNFVFPIFDAAIFDDDRVLENLSRSERRSMPLATYFTGVQTEILEHMRRTLTEWMLEVTDEERCDGDVFALAVNYLDRFLSVEAVHKSQLQVLGCACLFLASKVKQPQPLCARRLVEYTANSTSLSELMSWELLVLNRLRWDLCTVTAYDFLDHILHRLQLPQSAEETLRPHLHYFVALIATDYRLAVLPPSIIAVSSLCCTFALLLQDPTAARRMLAALKPIMKNDADLCEPYVERVYSFLQTSMMSANTVTEEGDL